MRDKSGIIQIVSDPNNSPAVHKIIESVRNEYVIQVSGSNSPGDGLVDLCMQVSGGSKSGYQLNISSGFGLNKTKENRS